MRTRGEGVKKSEIFADVINGSPLMSNNENTAVTEPDSA